MPMFENSTYKKEVQVAQELARQAGVTMLKYFDGDQQVELKGDSSPVTIADKLINDDVIEALAESFPDDGVVGEEASSADTSQQRLWYCDPIDGTAAYIWGNPTAMFSLGLVVDNQPVVGVAYDPFMDRMYTGVAGEGSYWVQRGQESTQQKLKVSHHEFSDSLIAVTSHMERVVRGQMPYLKELSDQGAHLASIGGAVFKACLVARGKMTGYIEGGVNRHDIAAVEVIVKEAGGTVTGWDGQSLDYSAPFKGAIVSNGIVHQQIVDIVNQ